MAEEAVTTLLAGLGRFDRGEEGFALLEVFLEVALPRLGPVVLDPAGLRLPDGMTDDRALVQGLIAEIDAEPPVKGLFRSTEREYDMADPQARWDYVRLAHCSVLATVWGEGRRTTYFEVSDHTSATYWLPESLKVAFFDAIQAKGWAVPVDWLTAVSKLPKPWWRRGV
ncbi:hypothetical protein E1263_35060 [Kribbella antibiotica]|uniref:Uncharacterized protein n=1 Tax=Kribbella antibiotica TaxID=190195 RepID=A0A4R4YPT9_9ACTN|nr:hypothetical protein [Kribbella antibiotica]TDD47175.1 hypothetical protein E1263_35060 [Kribbella antibiotica]